MRFCSGCLLLILMVASTASGQRMQSDSEVLDLNGRVKEMKESVEYRGSKEGSTTTVETVYRFTSYGALTEFIVHSGGQIQGRLVYTHNSDGSRSEKLLYSKDEGPTFRREVKTDGEGRKLQVAQYCGGGFLMYTEKYRYQPGDVVEVSKYNHDGHLTEVRHLKYADGRLSETTGPYDYMEVRTYYDGGQPKEVNVYGTKHQLASETTYAYKFDKYGNWIERHTRRRYREAGQQVEKESLDYRTITYYSTEGREADKGETTGERAAPDSGPEAEKSVPAIVRKSGGVLQGAALKRVGGCK